ncbi:hypothetical protein MSG28_006254 [Choristoneura fumiferana]|uniref:Uncharacterized protein n=1 Tax=Choristoneura fumiferana TaxID=7141 RepID=A0ACC0JEE5_CHOFU|nr:hypothetical protein MSG28_006254 [Choristoneura fumiferana]
MRRAVACGMCRAAVACVVRASHFDVVERGTGRGRRGRGRVRRERRQVVVGRAQRQAVGQFSRGLRARRWLLVNDFGYWWRLGRMLVAGGGLSGAGGTGSRGRGTRGKGGGRARLPRDALDSSSEPEQELHCEHDSEQTDSENRKTNVLVELVATSSRHWYGLHTSLLYRDDRYVYRPAGSRAVWCASAAASAASAGRRARRAAQRASQHRSRDDWYVYRPAGSRAVWCASAAASAASAGRQPSQHRSRDDWYVYRPAAAAPCGAPAAAVVRATSAPALRGQRGQARAPPATTGMCTDLRAAAPCGAPARRPPRPARAGARAEPPARVAAQVPRRLVCTDLRAAAPCGAPARRPPRPARQARAPSRPARVAAQVPRRLVCVPTCGSRAVWCASAAASAASAGRRARRAAQRASQHRSHDDRWGASSSAPAGCGSAASAWSRHCSRAPSSPATMGQVRALAHGDFLYRCCRAFCKCSTASLLTHVSRIGNALQKRCQRATASRLYRCKRATVSDDIVKGGRVKRDSSALASRLNRGYVGECTASDRISTVSMRTRDSIATASLQKVTVGERLNLVECVSPAVACTICSEPSMQAASSRRPHGARRAARPGAGSGARVAASQGDRRAARNAAEGSSCCVHDNCILAWSSSTGLQGAGSTAAAPHTSTLVTAGVSHHDTLRSVRRDPPSSTECFQLGPISTKSGSDDWILRKLRKLFKYCRNAYDYNYLAHLRTAPPGRAAPRAQAQATPRFIKPHSEVQPFTLRQESEVNIFTKKDSYFSTSDLFLRNATPSSASH